MLKLENRRKLFFLTAPILMFFVAACTEVCVPVDATPERATNETGSSHTIQAQVGADAQEEWIIIFAVLVGPNEGETSLADCNLFTDPGCSGEDFVDECSPSCQGTGPATVSWTYRGEEAGTDYIVVCAGGIRVFSAQQVNDLSQLARERLGTAQVDEDLLALLEDELEPFCDIIVKVWEEEDDDDDDPTRTPTATPTKTPTSTPTITPTSQPSRLGVVDAIFPGQRATPVPATLQPAVAAQPQQQAAPAFVRPPSTGGGGLR